MPGRAGSGRTGRRRRHRALRVTDHRQAPEQVGAAQVLDGRGDALLRAGGPVGGGDPQRQGQPGAQPGQLRGGVGLGGRPVSSEVRGEELDRFGGGEGVQGDPGRAVADDQPGEGVAAGDQGLAVRPAGQQWAHLDGIHDVVQHHQNPPPRHHGAVEADLQLQVHRDPFTRHAEGLQQQGQRFRGGDGRVPGVSA